MDPELINSVRSKGTDVRIQQGGRQTLELKVIGGVGATVGRHGRGRPPQDPRLKQVPGRICSSRPFAAPKQPQELNRHHPCHKKAPLSAFLRRPRFASYTQ
jgi:hypothetical protein